MQVYGNFFLATYSNIQMYTTHPKLCAREKLQNRCMSRCKSFIHYTVSGHIKIYLYDGSWLGYKVIRPEYMLSKAKRRSPKLVQANSITPGRCLMENELTRQGVTLGWLC